MISRSVVSAGVALAVLASSASAPERREPPASLAPLLRTLREDRVRPRVLDPTPRRLYVIVSQLTPERRAALEAAGLTIELPAPGAAAPPWHGGELVQGIAGADRDAALRALPFVLRLETPGTPWPAVGSVTSAGDAIHGGPEARTLVPGAGAGVAVGVISDGVERLGASMASGDLPGSVELVAAGGPPAGAGREGTAMLEIVHDLASGARLLFAAPRTSAEMVVAIDALAAAGAGVIVDDLVFSDEPKFVDGPVALAARRFARAGGVYVTAAGNFARAHWIGDYRRGSSPRFVDAAYPGVHLFAAGDAGNSLRVPAGAELLAVLQWNEPFGSAGRDFDLLLASQQSGDDRVLAASVDVQDGGGSPFEALRWVNDTGAPVDAYLAIAEFQSAAATEGTRLNLVVFSRSALGLEHVVTRDSVFGHAAVEEVLSVAAASAGDPGTVEDFSSRGPATLFFPRETRLVPRLTAVDGVETAVGGSGFFVNPFFGTSAAAPHVAACAALVRSVSPAAPAAALVATALDIGSDGSDLAAGAGLLDCAAAARLALGTGTAPEVSALETSFSPTAGVLVSGVGADADGDARTVTARVFDAVGVELAREQQRVTPAGQAFAVAFAFRGATLAGARDVVVEVADATGLASTPARAALACPGDGTVGDVFCGVGDLIERLRALPGAAGTRLLQEGRAATRALARAGATASRARAHRLLGRVDARLGRFLRRARRVRGDAAFLATLVAEAQGLRDRVRVLRQTFIPS